MWNSFALAFLTLTALPALDGTPTRDEARRAAILFPVVGALTGALLAAVWTLGQRVWTGDRLVAAALTLSAGAIFTRGTGLGGIARSADGLAAQGSGGDRTRAFAVMRDPRRGTTGLIALGAALALRLAFLAALPAPLAWPGLVLMGVMRGWAMAFALSAFPVAASSDNSALSEAGSGEFLMATALAIVCAAVLPTRGLLILLAVALIAAPLAQTVHRRLGSLNMPLCSALGEIAEIVTLACLSVRT